MTQTGISQIVNPNFRRMVVRHQIFCEVFQDRKASFLDLNSKKYNRRRFSKFSEEKLEFSRTSVLNLGIIF